MELSQDFIKQIQDILPDEWEQLCKAISATEPSVSVRVNARKGAEVPSGLAPVPWCELGAYLDVRPQFTFDPAFQSGRYYVQDASSMFLYRIIKHLVKEPVRYLDLCAAPGGKTTTALSALPEGSLVVGNEIVPTRAKVLKENIIKWGYSSAIVTSNAPADFKPLCHFFDVIATDVPCSGEGMMRKDDEAVDQWNPGLVEQCADRQHTIIDDIWESLRPGGLLIYSTCTYNRKENEEMVRYMEETYGAESIEIPVEKEWMIHEAIGTSDYCYRFMPHRTRGEGLFACALRKPDDEPRQEMRAPKAKKGKQAPKAEPAPAAVKKWLVDGDKFLFTVVDDSVRAFPKAYAQELAQVESALRVIHSGVKVGNIKGKNCIPSQSLALSVDLDHSQFAHAEVDYATAIAYLRGETITLSPDVPRGYVLITHAGTPVGFANNLGNRANNLYPKEWRIHSSHVPEQAPEVLKK